METKQQTSADTAAARPFAPDTLSCPNCHAALLRGMRFCRACGYRLGEGSAEYTETVRFDGAMPPARVGAAGPQTFEHMPAQPTTALAPQCARRFPWRGSWLMWVLIAVITLSAAGGGVLLAGFKARVRDMARREFVAPAPRSFFGTRGFTNVDEGAMVDAVVPGGPAERAGLIGGDIITGFDGKSPKDSDDIGRLLRSTPIGKTVEVVYLRDGQSHVTTLTTASSEAFNVDNDTLMGLTGRQGFLGVDSMTRVPVEGTSMYGIRLGTVQTNRPADLAGLRKGDIVVEFNGTLIRTETEFVNRIRRATPGQAVNIAVMRDGQRQEISVKMGRR